MTRKRPLETASGHFRRLGAAYERDAFASEGQLVVSQRELDTVRDALAGIPTGARILDAGAGNGRFTRPLVARGFHVTALDAEPAMLRSITERRPGTPTVLARLGEPLPIADASFDAAVSIRVLKWVPAWREALHELARVVRPGGSLVVEFANRRSVARFGYHDAAISLVTTADIARAGRAAGIAWHAMRAGTHLPFPCWQHATTPVRVSAARTAQRACDITLGHRGARSLILVGTVTR